MSHILHIGAPAQAWASATPIGNGNLGATVYGTVAKERIVFNEEWLWAGHNLELDTPELGKKLAVVRSLLLEGKNDEADKWAEEHLAEHFGFVDSFETAGELYIDGHPSGECESYVRDLDLDRGIATVAYTRAGVRYFREYFASYPKNLIGFSFSNDGGAKYDLDVRYDRPRVRYEKLEGEHVGIVGREVENGDTLVFHGQTDDGEHDFTVRVKIRAVGGTLSFDDECTAHVRGAERAEFFVSIETVGASRRPLPSFAGALDYSALRDEAAADVLSVTGRSDVVIEGDASLEALPVSARLAALRRDPSHSDPAFAALNLAYGKYLLIASSRPGTMPVNLQGMWCNQIDAEWNSDYHTNINVQMNYWPAETANLSDCTGPLFDYCSEILLPSARRTAAVSYGCRGAVVHHLSDLYGFSGPADGIWGLWTLGAAWLAYHYWEHYLYTGDTGFLREKAYPFIEACAVFFLDYMFEDESGHLALGPSESPENKYYAVPGGRQNCLSMTTAMDIEMIGGLWDFYVECEELLGIDPAQKEQIKAARAKLPPLQIGRFGQIVEWDRDYEETEPGHRHLSNLFGFFPGFSITEEKTPELYEAAKKTIDRRFDNGGGRGGWLSAWHTCIRAHFGQGEVCQTVLRFYYMHSLRDNLFNGSRPFQIDGNLGVAAGILEMLLQSRDGVIKVLPALAPEWKNGHFDRLVARGNWEISCVWKDGAAQSVTLHAVNAGKQTVIVGGRRFEVSLAAGEEKTLTL